MSNLTQLVADRIAEHRIKALLEQVEVAQVAGMDYQRYKEIESGNYSFTIGEVEQIAKAIGVEPKAIFCGCKSSGQ